jgi:hypothetical protein
MSAPQNQPAEISRFGHVDSLGLSKAAMLIRRQTMDSFSLGSLLPAEEPQRRREMGKTDNA